jgi:hypothetical protein
MLIGCWMNLKRMVGHERWPNCWNYISINVVERL